MEKIFIALSIFMLSACFNAEEVNPNYREQLEAGLVSGMQREDVFAFFNKNIKGVEYSYSCEGEVIDYDSCIFNERYELRFRFRSLSSC